MRLSTISASSLSVILALLLSIWREEAVSASAPPKPSDISALRIASRAAGSMFAQEAIAARAMMSADSGWLEYRIAARRAHSIHGSTPLAIISADRGLA